MMSTNDGSRWPRGRAAALVAALALAGAAAGQSRQVPAPAQAAPVVIEGAAIHPVSGPAIAHGHLVLDGGVITRLGPGAPPRIANAEVIDATGMHVYPGLIACETRLGLTETGAVDVTQDHDEYGDVTPEVRAAVAVNPDSDLIPVTRANGILTALTLPSGGAISGRAALIRLDGWTWEDLAIEADAGLVVSWPRTDVASAPWMRTSPDEQREQITRQLERMETLFDEAAAYLAAKDADPQVLTDQRWEGMRAALERRSPVFFRAASATQIESAVAFALRRGLRPIIVGGRDADRAAPLLRRHDVPVIVSGLHRLPSARHDAYDRPFTLPAALHEAGVRFAIASGAGSAHERNLNHNAATAAAYGLPREEALRAVTQSAAEILGVGDSLGSLEAGRAATLIVTTGDPLEITTDVLVAFIDGRRIDLGNRQKTLYRKYTEKYRQLGLLPDGP